MQLYATKQPFLHNTFMKSLENSINQEERRHWWIKLRKRLVDKAYHDKILGRGNVKYRCIDDAQELIVMFLWLPRRSRSNKQKVLAYTNQN